MIGVASFARAVRFCFSAKPRDKREHTRPDAHPGFGKSISVTAWTTPYVRAKVGRPYQRCGVVDGPSDALIVAQPLPAITQHSKLARVLADTAIPKRHLLTTSCSAMHGVVARIHLRGGMVSV